MKKIKLSAKMLSLFLAVLITASMGTSTVLAQGTDASSKTSKIYGNMQFHY